MFERFTERARQVVVLAQDEARSLNDYIGTEHILLGLLRDERGLGGEILASFDVTLDAVRAQVARIVGRREEVTTGLIPFTPRAKKVLELALREKQTLGHTNIGTEHLLLAILREGEGVAARLLREFGVDADAVRELVVDRSGGRRPRPIPRPSPPPRHRRRWTPARLVALGWALGAVTLGGGILVGWAIWH